MPQDCFRWIIERGCVNYEHTLLREINGLQEILGLFLSLIPKSHL